MGKDLSHLTSEEIETLMRRYYDGEAVSKLIKEYNISAHASELYKLYLSVGVVPRRNHRLSRLELLQTVPKPHQSRSSAAAAISREINAGILTCGRCSLGSLILCREKEFSFGFPACSVICSRCRTVFRRSSSCVRVGSCDICLLTHSNRSVCRSAWYHSASMYFIIRSQSAFEGHAS